MFVVGWLEPMLTVMRSCANAGPTTTAAPRVMAPSSVSFFRFMLSPSFVVQKRLMGSRTGGAPPPSRLR
jgi:hypothetical protein